MRKRLYVTARADVATRSRTLRQAEQDLRACLARSVAHLVSQVGVERDAEFVDFRSADIIPRCVHTTVLLITS